MQIAQGFGKVLMSNTMLFSSPLGQTYFSVFGDERINKSHKDILKATISVIKFYKIKEADKGKKKEKKDASSVHFWTIMILLIINEYSIGRHTDEDNKDLKETLTAAELSEIPPEKLENYIN